jgi:hypothetical protein
MTQHTEQAIKPCKFVNGACVNCEATERGDCEGYVCNDSLYASYTKREWVGLTDEEANLLWENTDDRDSWELIKRVEAKLKERNT